MRTNSVEKIFALGMNSEKMGRMNASVYWKGDSVIILNSDNTMMLKFTGLSPRLPEGKECKFFVKDYENIHMEMEGDDVIFLVKGDDYTKKKYCKAPLNTFDELDVLLSAHRNEKKEEETLEKIGTISLSNKIIELLDDSLSHVEMIGEKGEFILIQRDIYTGQRNEIRERKKGGLLLKKTSLDFDVKIGMRTCDLESLFLLLSSVEFSFFSDFTKVASANFSGLIANCSYDMLGELSPLKKDDTGGK